MSPCRERTMVIIRKSRATRPDVGEGGRGVRRPMHGHGAALRREANECGPFVASFTQLPGASSSAAFSAARFISRKSRGRSQQRTTTAEQAGVNTLRMQASRPLAERLPPPRQCGSVRLSGSFCFSAGVEVCTKFYNCKCYSLPRPRKRRRGENKKNSHSSGL